LKKKRIQHIMLSSLQPIINGLVRCISGRQVCHHAGTFHSSQQ